jgi:NADPH-dependent 2,4-dienoyl-CoA reductase/sulfur reductase-like enzyme
VAAERCHDVTVLEVMPQSGGQLCLTVRNRGRRDPIGIVDWRVSELTRLGVDVRYDTYADDDLVNALDPEVVIVAPGGVAGVLAAEVIVDAGSELEFVTPERFFVPEVGGLNHVPYARASAKPMRGSRSTAGCSRCGATATNWSPGPAVTTAKRDRRVDHVVVECGTAPSDELYFALKPRSVNRGAVDYGALLEGRPQQLATNADGTFQLFRIGDTVSARNIHTAIYDAQRSCKDL